MTGGVEIFVIDPPGSTGQSCNCDKEAMFLLGINGVTVHLCPECIGEVAKRIVDALV